MKDYLFHYSEKSASPWGRLSSRKKVLDGKGIIGNLQEMDVPAPESNRGFKDGDFIKDFWVSIWCGASRFEPGDYFRYGKTLTQIFDWKQGLSQRKYSRFFHKFGYRQSASVFKKPNHSFFAQWKPDNSTIEVDSSVLTCYSDQQQGVNKDYIPHEPGRNNHHPLMALSCKFQRFLPIPASGMHNLGSDNLKF
jgi:hypothetical protein